MTLLLTKEHAESDHKLLQIWVLDNEINTSNNIVRYMEEISALNFSCLSLNLTLCVCVYIHQWFIQGSWHKPIIQYFMCTSRLIYLVLINGCQQCTQANAIKFCFKKQNNIKASMNEKKENVHCVQHHCSTFITIYGQVVTCKT